jgi:hypothetical protein
MDPTESNSNRVAAESGIVNLAPADQPTTIREIAERLFPAYTIDGGTAHLAGCTLEDRLFLRVRTHHAGKSVEFYLDDGGKELDPTLVGTLGMGRTIELKRPPVKADARITSLAERGRVMLVQQFPAESPPEHVDVAAIWCKYAQGKVRFTAGGNMVDLPFSGWARILEPPAFVCPSTGVATFQLAATDDQKIVAAERIALCDETGRRMLDNDLVTCSATGRRVLAELTEVCPVSGKPVLRAAMVRCAMCGETVAPAAIEGGACRACRTLEPVGKNDPRLVRLLGEHPPMDRWRNWRMSETATVYILTAAGWFRKLLVVVDKESLQLRLLATGGRLLAGWHAVDPQQYNVILGE